MSLVYMASSQLSTRIIAVGTHGQLVNQPTVTLTCYLELALPIILGRGYDVWVRYRMGYWVRFDWKQLVL